MRIVIWFGALLLFCICQSVFPDRHDVMRIAAWNLEHLNAENGAGCVTRDQGDYDAIAGQIQKIDPDVVAFQEVENKAAAQVVGSFETSGQYEYGLHPEVAAFKLAAEAKCPGRGKWGAAIAILQEANSGIEAALELARQKQLRRLCGAFRRHRQNLVLQASTQRQLPNSSTG